MIREVTGRYLMRLLGWLLVGFGLIGWRIWRYWL